MGDVANKLAYFHAITGQEDPDLCREILSAHGWNLEQAISTFTALNSDNPSVAVGISGQSSTDSHQRLEESGLVVRGPAPPGLAWKIISLPFSIISGSLGCDSSFPLVSISAAAAEAMEFMANFERDYGETHPNFVTEQQSRDAFKLFFVYLHSPDHPDTPLICESTVMITVQGMVLVPHRKNGIPVGINKLLGTLPSIANFWGEFYQGFVTLVSEQLDPWRRPGLGLLEVGRLPPVLTGLSEGSPNAVVVGSEEGGFVMIQCKIVNKLLGTLWSTYKHYRKEIIARELQVDEGHPDVHRGLMLLTMELINITQTRPPRYVNNTHLSARVGRLNLDWIDPDRSSEK
ncbi:metal-dependent protein hydrolase [Actinidia rufa]|uniref:Metal-dependent protein hydrolase n=1 Tax=Actinidia rufa TaxID=165716 RepID=A0A7J0GPN9_9ERIC|nr:metal-dependent protein hydrolase [Actinidia rufa]